MVGLDGGSGVRSDTGDAHNPMGPPWVVWVNPASLRNANHLYHPHVHRFLKKSPRKNCSLIVQFTQDGSIE